MIASSRMARVLPYAQWVGYAIQLGYFGYRLYTMYREYVAIAERDQRNGVHRNMDQYMALVVKPLRQHQDTSNQVNNEERDDNSENRQANKEPKSNSNQGTEGANQATNNDVYQPIPSTSRQLELWDNRVTEEDKENSTATCNHNRNHNETNSSSQLITIGDSDSSPDVTIIHDSRFDGGPIEYPTLDRIETLSTTSTSLESTDSNRGIIGDMYNECFICARKLDNPSKPVATLPFCMHPFHKSCLDSVIKWHQRCPVCDFHIFSPI